MANVASRLIIAFRYGYLLGSIWPAEVRPNDIASVTTSCSASEGAMVFLMYLRFLAMIAPEQLLLEDWR